MSLKFALPLAVASVCLPLAGTASATTYTETGDAGDLPSSAQLIASAIGNSTTSATLTTQINGSLLLTNGLSESDMYTITISAPSTFTASNNFFVAGANNFDSTISLFTTAGVGIASNDDAAGGTGSQSTLTVSLAAGTYELLISGAGRNAADSTGAAIFPNVADGSASSSNVTYAATSTSPITQYVGNSSDGGSYRLTVSAVPNAVPEPSSLTAIAAGLASLGLAIRRRAK